MPFSFSLLFLFFSSRDFISLVVNEFYFNHFHSISFQNYCMALLQRMQEEKTDWDCALNQLIEIALSEQK